MAEIRTFQTRAISLWSVENGKQRSTTGLCIGTALQSINLILNIISSWMVTSSSSSYFIFIIRYESV
ncbi:hypothetical protein PMAYCL1PPCAC_20873 [Pristionchus mayeri]|uniref:Uncharacterized protein n=1 Tax=Pristionchus mayeri TaxID=1317129 RepID=A0AAN5CTX5_9BILA|nr:hypothetical protein PMAYCL1PPCAC_20873 [Pristionchus mayeri]